MGGGVRNGNEGCMAEKAGLLDCLVDKGSGVGGLVGVPIWRGAVVVGSRSVGGRA